MMLNQVLSATNIAILIVANLFSFSNCDEGQLIFASVVSIFYSLLTLNSLAVRIHSSYISHILCGNHFCVFFLLLYSLPFTHDHSVLYNISQIFRHGDRTPVETYPNDPYKDPSLWPVGFGQLTNVSHKFSACLIFQKLTHSLS